MDQDRVVSGRREISFSITTVHSRRQDIIVVDDSSDVEMIDAMDLVEDNPSFSRESSRTLSVESLPSLIEMRINGNNAEIGPLAREYLEMQREQVRRAHRRAPFYQE
ncbi:hypothetical protein F5B18DRAFT_619470 [Nemania serpens]|nr:hypothetical protein F5B18DRAFT_619470 [Nemania serpens]